MPTKKEIKKHLSKEKVYATFLKASRDGLEYYAQLLWPGKAALFAIYFHVPISKLGYKTFDATMPALRIADYLVTGEGE